MKPFNFAMAMMYALGGFKVTRLNWDGIGYICKQPNEKAVMFFGHGGADELACLVEDDDFTATDWVLCEGQPAAPQLEVVEWVPCAKRLPEKAGNYLVFRKHPDVQRDIVIEHYSLTCGFFGCNAEWIAAWSELPKPYRGEA